MPDLNLEPADFIRAAKGEDTQIMLTLTNVYQRMLKLPEGDSKDRLKQAIGYIRNEIATLSRKDEADVKAVFEAIVARDGKPEPRKKPKANKVSSAELASLASKILSRKDEDWTFVDPEEIKKLAASVLSQANVD